jgi:excisionase family DNA binding protein
MTAPTMLTVRMVAARFRLDPSTVYRMIDRGEIPVRKYGQRGAIRIPVAWVEQEEACQEPTEAPISGDPPPPARGIYVATSGAEPVPSPRAKRIADLLRLP